MGLALSYFDEFVTDIFAGSSLSSSQNYNCRGGESTLLQLLAIWLPMRQDEKISSSHGQQIQIHNIFSFQANASVRCGAHMWNCRVKWLSVPLSTGDCWPPAACPGHLLITSKLCSHPTTRHLHTS